MKWVQLENLIFGQKNKMFCLWKKYQNVGQEGEQN